jgi:putative ABC transport system permease protein
VIGVAGIYGVTASIVAQQTREIGIRLALGATAGRVVRSVALGTGRLLLAGAALGLAAAWAASGILSSLVFGIDPRDALPYAVPFAVLCAVGLLAALLPARRAARIDPVIALRNE